MSSSELSKDYRRVKTIRLNGDRNATVRLELHALGIFFGILLLRGLFGLFFPRIRLRFPDDLLYLSPMIFGILVGAVVVGILHELLHALFMKRYGAKEIRFGLKLGFAYTGAPSVYFGIREYRCITLAPALILGVPLLSASLFFSPQVNLVLYVNFALHLAGCVGDFRVVGALKDCPADALVCDVGVEMRVFQR